MGGQFRSDGVHAGHVGGGQVRQRDVGSGAFLGFDVGVRPSGRIVSSRQVVRSDVVDGCYRLDFGSGLTGSDFSEDDTIGLELLLHEAGVLVSRQIRVLPTVGVCGNLKDFFSRTGAHADGAGGVGPVRGLGLLRIGNGVSVVSNGQSGRGASEMVDTARIESSLQGEAHIGFAGEPFHGVQRGQGQRFHHRMADLLTGSRVFDGEDALIVNGQIAGAFETVNIEGDIGVFGRMERHGDSVTGLHILQVDGDVQSNLD